MISVRCLVCGEKIRLREIPDEGDFICCDDCDSELIVVISTDPLKVREITGRHPEEEDEDEY